MHKRILLTLLVVLLVPDLHAQHLLRKGSLGIQFYQTVPDSLKEKLHYRQGVIIQRVVPGTTASAIGIHPGDIIIQINTTPVNQPADIFLAAKELREDQAIQVRFIRAGKTATRSGKVVAKPKETNPGADIVYGEFPYEKGYVRTIYKKPKGKKPLGTVYFLQGLPCYSMDNFMPLDKTKQALDAMVQRGFAVYRMEKADIGDNMNIAPCETMGFDEELAMYTAGYENLLRQKHVDTAAIFLFGHSMGGITAPLLAEVFQPKGVVVYGTVFKPWMDYLFDAYYYQLQYYGEDLATLRETIEKIKPHAYDYFYYNKPIEAICKSEEGKFAMEQLLSYDVTTRLAASGRSPLCHKELNNQKVAAAWKNTNSHVLAVYGEADIAAIHPDDHVALVNYINHVHPGKGTFWQAPGTTHMFEAIGTMQEYLEWQKKPLEFYQYAESRFNPKVFDYVCDWMKDAMKK